VCLAACDAHRSGVLPIVLMLAVAGIAVAHRWPARRFGGSRRKSLGASLATAGTRIRPGSDQNPASGSCPSRNGVFAPLAACVIKPAILSTSSIAPQAAASEAPDVRIHAVRCSEATAVATALAIADAVQARATASSPRPTSCARSGVDLTMVARRGDGGARFGWRSDEHLLPEDDVDRHATLCP
jgi:hypothetical protein